MLLSEKGLTLPNYNGTLHMLHCLKAETLVLQLLSVMCNNTRCLSCYLVSNCLKLWFVKQGQAKINAFQIQSKTFFSEFLYLEGSFGGKSKLIFTILMSYKSPPLVFT